MLTWGAVQVAVSQHWILRATRLGFDAAAIADCRMPTLGGLSRQQCALRPPPSALRPPPAAAGSRQPAAAAAK